MGRIIKDGVIYASTNAWDITYSNTLMNATNVQDAIDELSDAGRARHAIFKMYTSNTSTTKKTYTINNVTQATQFVNDHEIDTGNFSGLEVGNTIKIGSVPSGWNANSNEWIIVGFDTEYMKGPGKYVDKHHITLMAAHPLFYEGMTYISPPAQTPGYPVGYYFTNLHQNVLNGSDSNSVYSKISAIIGTQHILERACWFVNGYDYPDKQSQPDNPSRKDHHTGGWYKKNGDGGTGKHVCFTLPSELQVTGTALIGDDMDAGETNSILPYFALLGKSIDTNDKYWLRNHRCSPRGTIIPSYPDDFFGYVNNDGSINTTDVSADIGVRPIFCLC